MLFGFLAKRRLPRDRVTRISLRAKRAGKPHAEEMKAALARLAALPGIADIKETKRVPRGFFEAFGAFRTAYDAWLDAVRPFVRGADDAHRAGEGDGSLACYEHPLGVGPVEALAIFRASRPFPDYPQLAEQMGRLAERQFTLIQQGHTGKDPEKIRLGSKAAREGRLAYVREKHVCPFLDTERRRCRLGEAKPLVCRMHHLAGTPEDLDPATEHYPRRVVAYNLRPPIGVQAKLTELDKRTTLAFSPFLFAGQLQALELAGGGLIQEVGEAPARMQQGGRIDSRVNRNRPTAKKFQKKKKKKKRRNR